MEIFWQELTAGFSNGEQLERTVIRLTAALVLGSIIGTERQAAGKVAGLRTHILVTFGSCVFVLAASSFGMSSDGLSRVIQGIITGIGFIGAGSILKTNDAVHGLTSSAGIWIAAAIGVAVGLGQVGIAILATVITLLVLTVFKWVEKPHHPEIKN